MINFENVEALVSHMFDKVNAEDPVTVVADKDLAVDVLAELLTYNNIILEFVDIDSYEYDKEYYVTLSLDEDKNNETDYWHVSIEKAYNDVREAYWGTDGYVLFHEDINSKILVDIQNNENVEMSGRDWFIIGKDDSFESDGDEENDSEDEDTDEDSNREYTVTVKCNVDPSDVMTIVHMYEMFEEMNMFRRLLGW